MKDPLKHIDIIFHVGEQLNDNRLRNINKQSCNIKPKFSHYTEIASLTKKEGEKSMYFYSLWTP